MNIKENIFALLLVCLLLLFANKETTAQSLSHPHIWVDNEDKEAILGKIETEKWAKDLFDQYKNRVEAAKNAHLSNPSATLSSIPGLPGNRNTHRDILTLGFDAALLYWLTDEKDYAQLAADILFRYAQKITAISGDVDFHTVTNNDGYLIDSRFAYTKPPVIYDFVHSFLVDTSTTVYNEVSGEREAFDMDIAQAAFKKLANNVFDRGGMNSNHPILEGPGALFNVLAIEDDATRATYFNKFMNGASRQNGYYWMLKECKDAGGLWPEATGYSIGPQRIILEMMNVIDRYDPSLNIVDNNKSILEKSFFYENYRFPNGTNVMRFGDAHRNSLNSKNLMERVWVLSQNKGYNELENKAYNMLQALYKDAGGFSPDVETQTLEWNNPYYLLWGSNIETDSAEPIEYDRSINIGYAGIAMQRNINTSNPVEYGLMGYTGGAHYVHSHLTGIDLEIYGLGAAIGSGGGDVGATNRNDDEFRNYHRIYAGHNTVIVNGKSKGRGDGAWKRDNQLYQNKTKTVAAEPASQSEAISAEFSFSIQVLDDNVNNAKQQRVLSIIRTGNKTGYYFDLFRSKSLGTNNYHDYLYHNVGDRADIAEIQTNMPIELSEQSNRYTSTRSNFSGTYIMFPGWHYFQNVKTSPKTSSGVKATIPMTKVGTGYMHMLMPGGEEREYTACKGPATIEGQLGYGSEKTPVVSIRHYGEAWTKPFISIFEPSRQETGSVREVTNLYNNNVIIGAKVVSVLEDQIINDYILSNINDNESVNLSYPNISFKGRFAMVRIIERNDSTDLSLYIGEGDSLSVDDNLLLANENRKGIMTVENVEIEKSALNIEITAPADSASIFLGDTVHIAANAESEKGNIEKVDFKLNGISIGQDTIAPYELSWMTNEKGNYIVNAVAYDNFGQLQTSESITIAVSNGITIESVSAVIEPNFAENLLDENIDNESRWGVQEFPQNVVFDLGRRRLVTGTRMWTFRERAYQYTVEVSDSANMGFEMVADENENTNTAQPLETSFSQPGRYLRLTVTGAHEYDGDWVNINEFEIISEPDTSSSNETISVNELNVGIKVYPNPVTHDFYIDLGTIKKAELVIYNYSGEMVFRKSTTEKIIQLNKGNNFSKGIYLIMVADENQMRHIQKIIIK